MTILTKKLQVQPTSARKRGEQANPEHPRLYKFTSWLLEFSRETYNSRDVLDPILAAFQSKTAELNQLKHEFDLEIEIHLVVHIHNGSTPAITITPELGDFIAKIGASIYQDTYVYAFNEPKEE